MTTHTVDVAVVGAGTAGCYAAATVAREGLDVVVLERKSVEEAGHIACGDALKGAADFPEVIPKSRLDPAITNTDVDHGRFEIPARDTVVDIPVPGELAVVDRWEFGRQLIAGAESHGAEFHYDTVVKDVLQDEGRVVGVRAVRAGEPVEYRAEVVVDGAGALSILQDKADLSGATFDTNVRFTQFCSAYREIVEVDEPVEWSDALVFKPTERAAGYLWYFPRTPTTINAGLGFQMNEQPMKLADSLERDLRTRPEFEGAEVRDKLGAALPTRRPYDSAVAPGYVAVGDAAGHVNPTTGGGIAGAAFAAVYAAETAVEAITEDRAGEEAALWEYNSRVMDHFGGRYSALDVYNVFMTGSDIGELTALLAAMPTEKLSEALYSGSTDVGALLKLRTLLRTRGHWDTLLDLYRTKRLADDLLEHYRSYPDSPAGFEAWRAGRDAIMDRVYETTGAEAKY